MNPSYEKLLKNNKEWAMNQKEKDPEFFSRLSKQQTPEYLFVGCSDSRIPVSDITGTIPGQVFVHRNIANLVVNIDMNFLSVLQYSVEVLKVKHIIVCGHYGCGGVLAALTNKSYGLMDKWLRNIKDTYRLHKDELDKITDENAKAKRMVEINIIEQVYNIYKTGIVQKTWKDMASLRIHGWVYNIEDGLIRDLGVDIDQECKELDYIYKYNLDY